MSMYETGKITGKINTTLVTGIDTKWDDAKNGIAAGAILVVVGTGKVDMYQISKVNSAIQLTLSRTITQDFTNSPYGIIVAESNSTASFANQLTAMLSYYQTQLNGWQQILTGTGDIKLTAPDGTAVTVKSQTAFNTAVSNALDKTKNGTDVPDKVAFRKNIGLKTAAERDVGTVAGTVAAGDDARILGAAQANTLGGAAKLNVGTAAGTVAAGNDSRIVGAAQASTLGNAAKLNVGTVAGTVAAGNDSRIANAVQSMSSGNLMCLELYSNTPFIDFHYANTNADYDVRLINSSNGFLECSGLFGAAGNYRGKRGASGIWGTNGFNFFWTTGLEAWVDNTYVGAVQLTSDRRLKQDINDTNDNLEKINQLRPVTYRYRDIGIFKAGDVKRGLIAQEVAKIIPEAVTGTEDPDDIDLQRPLALEPLTLISVLVGAVKEQSEQVSSLRSDVEALKERLHSLL
ncbi:MAG: tail fiber domain-containing protein [Chania sp.]